MSSDYSPEEENASRGGVKYVWWLVTFTWLTNIFESKGDYWQMEVFTAYITTKALKGKYVIKYLWTLGLLNQIN